MFKVQKNAEMLPVISSEQMLEAPSLRLESRANSRSELREYIKKAASECCHLSTITRPGHDFTAPGLSHEQGRPRRESGRLCVCGREHEGETVITNSSPGSPRSVD